MPATSPNYKTSLRITELLTVMHSSSGPRSPWPRGGALARPRDLDFLWACIRLAAQKGHVEVIRYLLEIGWGCDVQAFNNAIDSGSTEVVQMFIDKDPSLIAYVLT